MAGGDCKSEGELDRLDSDQLVAYIHEQRELKHPDCVRRAMGVLAFGYMNFVTSKVSEKVPRQDIDDVAGQVLESALRSAFDGKSIGQFVSWLKVIIARRIADYHGRAQPPEEPLPEEHEGEENVWGPGAAEEDGFVDDVAYREVAGRLLEELSDVHQMVIRLYGPVELGYANHSAAETSRQVEGVHRGTTMSEANVHKIWSRFRRDLIKQLGLE